METTLEIAEKDYISRWKVASKQHFDDGDYCWVCDLIKDPPYHRILEIGCGAGHSTLSFLQKQNRIEGAKTHSLNEMGSLTEEILAES